MNELEVLERLQKYFQIQINNLNADEMAEGPFEDDDDEEYGATWQRAAEIIDANGGLVIRFEFCEPK